MFMFNTVDLMQKYARATKNFCMYISWSEEDLEVVEAAPYLKNKPFIHSPAILVFHTEEEMNHYYDMTVGDDGSDLNLYSGPARVYALTCSNKGELLMANT